MTCWMACVSSCAGSSCGLPASRRWADEDEFSFWHVLVRDVAYQQIPRGRRAEKHVRAAEWVEQAAQERVSDHAEILVYHYDQAVELRKAAGESRPADDLDQRLAGFLVVAGDRAMQLDIDAAEAAYRRALELSEGQARAGRCARQDRRGDSGAGTSRGGRAGVRRGVARARRPRGGRREARPVAGALAPRRHEPCIRHDAPSHSRTRARVRDPTSWAPTKGLPVTTRWEAGRVKGLTGPRRPSRWRRSSVSRTSCAVSSSAAWRASSWGTSPGSTTYARRSTSLSSSGWVSRRRPRTATSASRSRCSTGPQPGSSSSRRGSNSRGGEG